MIMVMRIDFLAWHSARPLALPEVEARIAAVEGFYPHALYTRSMKFGASGHTGLVAWLPKSGHLAELAGAAGDAVAYASHLPFGISQFVPLKGMCRAADILALHERVKSAPELMTKLGTPLNLVHLSSSGGLYLNNDYRGLAEVFHHAGKGLHVWSNRLSMPLVFALEAPRESVVAAQLRAVFSYYPRTHTPFSNVSRVDGGTAVFAGDWPAEPLINRRKLLLEMLATASGQQGAPVDYAGCGLRAGQMMSEIASFWSGPMRSGLTGGRDSRAILAFLIAGGITDKVPLMTTKILKQDYEPAAALIAACKREGHNVTWDLQERNASSYSATNRDQAWEDFPAGRYSTPVLEATVKGLMSWARRGSRPGGSQRHVYQANPLLDRMVYQFHRLDGQTMPIGYFTAPAVERPDLAKNLLLGGQSGEVLRASGYTRESIDMGIDEWLKRRTKQQFRLNLPVVGKRERIAPYTNQALRHAHAEWMQYIEEARAAGIGGFHLLDYMNVAGKQSRRIDVPKQLLLVCPLSHPYLLEESYKLTPERRIGNEFHIELIKAVAPYLLEAPFSFQLPKETADLRLDLTGKPQFWDSEAVPGFAQIIKESWRWSDTFVENSIKSEFGEDAQPELNPYQRDTIGGYLLWRSGQGAYSLVLAAYINSQRKAVAAAA